MCTAFGVLKVVNISNQNEINYDTQKKNHLKYTIYILQYRIFSKPEIFKPVAHIGTRNYDSGP